MEWGAVRASASYMVIMVILFEYLDGQVLSQDSESTGGDHGLRGQGW